MVNRGDVVKISTLMGHEVAKGVAIWQNDIGVFVENIGFYRHDLYDIILLSSIDESSELEFTDDLLTFNERVARKLQDLGEANAIDDDDQKVNTKTDKKSSKKQVDDNQKQSVNDKDTGVEGLPDVNSIDPESLPLDIQKSVVASKDLTDEQLNSVLSDIGDVAVKALQRVNVKDTEVYKLVAKIQDAVHNTLKKEKTSSKGKE